MVRWQPPPADDQNGEITGYKIRYRKGARKSEATEVVAGAQLHKLLDSKLLVFSVHFIYRKPFWNKWTVLLSSKTLLLLSWDPKLHDVHRCSFTPTGLSCKKSTLLIFLFFSPQWLDLSSHIILNFSAQYMVIHTKNIYLWKKGQLYVWQYEVILGVNFFEYLIKRQSNCDFGLYRTLTLPSFRSETGMILWTDSVQNGCHFLFDFYVIRA